MSNIWSGVREELGCPPLSLEQLAEEVSYRAGLKTEIARAYLLQAFENARLFDQKHQQYGPGNFSRNGCLVATYRIHDKVQRLLQHFEGLLAGKPLDKEKQSLLFKEEFGDIANIAVIAQLVEKGAWR